MSSFRDGWLHQHEAELPSAEQSIPPAWR